jgi:hypothetical protein
MAVQKKPASDDVVRARAEGRTYTAQELADRASQLEAKIAQLRNRYEQYFLGLERKPPNQERESLHKELDQLRQVSTPNTAVKFRLNTLFNRMLTYERMWMRTEKDIEEGRYRRDLFKAKLHAQRRGAAAAPSEDISTDFEETTDADVQRQPPAPPPPPAPTLGPDDRRLKAIYDAFVMAKRECREPTEGLTFDQVASRIRSQIPQIAKQSGGKNVDFKVVIKDGKATLRAVVKE